MFDALIAVLVFVTFGIGESMYRPSDFFTHLFYLVALDNHMPTPSSPFTFKNDKTILQDNV